MNTQNTQQHENASGVCAQIPISNPNNNLDPRLTAPQQIGLASRKGMRTGRYKNGKNNKNSKNKKNTSSRKDKRNSSKSIIQPKGKPFRRLKVLHFNVNGLQTNKANAKHLISSLEPDIICLQETWWRSQYRFNVPGYKTIFRNRVRVIRQANKEEEP